MTEKKFFVYGSMSEGLVHFQKIKDFIVCSEPAQIQGKAYRLKVGFPVILQEGADTISGELVTLRATDLLFELLDQFHGFSQMDESQSLYFRRQVTVCTGGVEQTVEAYLLNPRKLPKTAIPIEQGDWRRSLAQEPSLIERLTERQKTYIAKLAKTGREIIPIDLSLYRELMNLEMIVDKGRRLALSKTGHEVLRYLS